MGPSRAVLLLLFNAGMNDSEFWVPRPPDGASRHLAVDTSRSGSRDLFATGPGKGCRVFQDLSLDGPLERNIVGQPVRGRIAIRCAFVDIGGVLLTDGWDHHARKRAATAFKLNWQEMEERHHLMIETFEEGKLTLQEYLGRTVFDQKRPFTRAQFWRFMCAQSKPYPEMLELLRQLKLRHGLKIAAVSNEARELKAYRIGKFRLDRFVDFFVSSCFVHLRKPDSEVFRLALDIAQVPARQVVYIENTPMFVRIAEGVGIRGILHTNCNDTRAKLSALGLPTE